MICACVCVYRVLQKRARGRKKEKIRWRYATGLRLPTGTTVPARLSTMCGGELSALGTCATARGLAATMRERARARERPPSASRRFLVARAFATRFPSRQRRIESPPAHPQHAKLRRRTVHTVHTQAPARASP